MIRSNLCDYSDAYILKYGTVTLSITEPAGTAVNNTNKKVIFKNCALFTDCIAIIHMQMILIKLIQQWLFII